MPSSSPTTRTVGALTTAARPTIRTRRTRRSAGPTTGSPAARTSSERQSEKCNVCPQAIKGSRQTDQGKPAAACAVHRNLAVVPRSKDLGAAPLLRLKIPQTSDFDGLNKEAQAKGMFAFSNYLNFLKSKGVPFTYSLTTRIRFDNTKSYPKLWFSPGRWLTEEEAATCAEVAGSPSLDDLLKTDFTGFGSARPPGITEADEEDDDEAPFEIAPAAAPKAAAPKAAASSAPPLIPAPAAAAPTNGKGKVTAAQKKAEAAATAAAARKAAVLDDDDEEDWRRARCKAGPGSCLCSRYDWSIAGPRYHPQGLGRRLSICWPSVSAFLILPAPSTPTKSGGCPLPSEGRRVTTS